MTAVLRAHAAINEAGLAGAGRLTRATNSLNEVWFFGSYIVRVNPVPGYRRLLHERQVLNALAPDIPVATVVDYGESYFGEWLIVDRVHGQELSRTWATMSEHYRERALTSLGSVLQTLHHIEPGDRGIDPAPHAAPDSLACPHQLPVGRLLDLLAQSAHLPHVDTGVIRAAVELVLAAADALDDAPTTLIHGDLHFENVLCDGERLTAILDWEWARAGPADLDLDVLLHSLADPALHVGADYAAEVRRQDYDHVSRWLRASYPELFSHPRLAERLTVYRLSYDTRALLQDPPDGPPKRLSPHHPYRRLQRVVEGRSDIGWILAS